MYTVKNLRDLRVTATNLYQFVRSQAYQTACYIKGVAYVIRRPIELLNTIPFPHSHALSHILQQKVCAVFRARLKESEFVKGRSQLMLHCIRPDCRCGGIR